MPVYDPFNPDNQNTDQSADAGIYDPFIENDNAAQPGMLDRMQASAMGGFSRAAQDWNKPFIDPYQAPWPGNTKLGRVMGFGPQGDTGLQMAGDIVGGLASAVFTPPTMLAQKGYNALVNTMSPENQQAYRQGEAQLAQGIQNPQNYHPNALADFAIQTYKNNPEFVHDVEAAANLMYGLPALKAATYTAPKMLWNIGKEGANIGIDAYSAAMNRIKKEPIPYKVLNRDQIAMRKTPQWNPVSKFSRENLVRPAKGMRTTKDLNRFEDWMYKAVDWIDSHPNVFLTRDPELGTVSPPYVKEKYWTGNAKEYTHLPRTVEDAVNSFEVAEDFIGKCIKDEVAKASIKGGSVPLQNQIDALNKLKADLSNELRGTEKDAMLKKIDDELSALSNQEAYPDLSSAQKQMQNFNNQLDQFLPKEGWWHNPEARMVIVRANALRSQIDDAVQSLTGGNVAELKSAYQAFHKTLPALRKLMIRTVGKGMPHVTELTNVVSFSMLMKALAAWKPSIALAAASGKGAAEWMAFLKDPNRRIAQMFDDFHVLKSGTRSKMLNKAKSLVNPDTYPSVDLPIDFNGPVAPRSNALLPPANLPDPLAQYYRNIQPSKPLNNIFLDDTGWTKQ